jgi:hypothetical protein
MAFEAALQSSKSIDAFLEDLFNFLSRRTDFFVECPPEGGPIGFKEGHAEKMLVSKFRKWQAIHRETKKDLPLEKLQSQVIESEKKPSGNETKRSDLMPKLPPPNPNNSSDAYNGATTDKYSWSQTISELDVKVFVGPEVVKGKAVTVDIKSDSLTVRVNSEKEPILTGRFEFPIVKDESYWNLVPGEAVHVYLQKSQERWWKALLEGEAPIDMSKIEPIKPMEDLPDAEQMKIQELLWQEEQKRKGIVPGNSEMEKILRQAWDVEGSPFQGQPFDPSRVNFNQSSNTFNP